MIRKFFLMAICMLSMTTIYGRQISEESAKELALAFYSNNSTSMKISPATASEMKLVHKQMSGDMVDLFIFNRGEKDGFIIISGDDATVPVLGYSASGRFSSEDMPPSLKSWLNEYSRQIEYLRNNPSLSAPSSSNGEDFASIEPLIQSHWEQASPYNDQCPEYRGERCLTGCSATAMAMVMKYYEYPKQGTGSYTYTPTNNRRLGKLTADFGNTTYDWDNMLDEYWWGYYNDEQANAVATLMYHCGVSINMQYDPAASGAYSQDWMVALKTYFGYDDGVHIVLRDFYSTQSWNEMIYNELAAGRPVLYSGSSAYGGHAFVCDGYSADGYFHINWGWAGMSDGYFLLSALDPYEMGSGGSDGGFNYRQDATIGIKPDDGIVDNTYPRMLVYGDFMHTQTRENYDWFEGVNDPMNANGIFNMSGETTEVEVGVLVINNDTEEEYISSMGSDIFKPMTGCNFICDMGSLNLPDGDYKVYPICRYIDNTEWQIIPCLYNYQQYLNLNVKEGVRTYSNVEGVKHYEIEVIDYSQAGEFYENEVVEFSIIVKNNDNINATEKVFFRWFSQETEEEVYFGGGNWAKPEVGSSDEVNYYMSYMPLEAGSYTMIFYDSMDNVISNSYTIKVLRGAKIEIAECNYNETIYGERKFNMSGTFTNVGERDFMGTIVFRMLDDTGLEGVTSNVGNYTLAPGEGADFEVNYDSIEGLEAGREYTILFSVVYGREYKNICEPIIIKVSDEMLSVNSIDSCPNSPVEYFNLQGVRVANPENGLYIRRQGSKVEKVFLNK